jgi:hypothetical protein
VLPFTGCTTTRPSARVVMRTSRSGSRVPARAREEEGHAVVAVQQARATSLQRRHPPAGRIAPGL